VIRIVSREFRPGSQYGEGMDNASRHRVVVVGAGFGGLFATKALRRADVDVTLINGTPYHLFQPLLYQVATGILSPGEIAPPVREILRRQRNVKVLLGTVTEVDVEHRTVTAIAPGTSYKVEYDSLIVAAGAAQSYFGNDQFAEFAPGMKSIDDALELRGRIFGAFELAELETDPAAIERWLTFVVVGAGPTGVEMAGQIAELAHRTLPGEYKNIDPSQARIVLMDALDTVLPSFGDHLSTAALRQLHKIGVEVELGTKVVSVDSDGIEVETVRGHQRIETFTKIWAAGVSAPSLSRQLAERTGAETDRAGRIKVNPDCTVPGHPEIFAIGDTVAIKALDGSPVPGIAPAAKQEGTFVAETIRRRLAGKAEPRAFHYHHQGSLAQIGKRMAVIDFGWIKLRGALAWWLWGIAHIYFLVGVRSRLSVALNWLWIYTRNQRSARLITSAGGESAIE